jgi:hypothetical protein
MTDLPRFHKGSIGPLDYSTINEMMARLDALLPLVQSGPDSGKSRLEKRGEVMLVQYRLFYDPDWPDLVNRYEWRQIILRGERQEGEEEFPDATLPIDEPVYDDDEDFDQISEKTEFRYGTVVETTEDGGEVESDSYAVMLTNPVPEGTLPPPIASEGIAVCFALHRHDGVKRYALMPIYETEDTTPPITPKLVRLGEVIGVGQLAGAGGTTIYFKRYSCNRLFTSDIDPDGNTSQGGYSLMTDEEWWDFSIHQGNMPTITTGAVPTLRDWDNGTIMVGIYLGAGVWANSCYARFDVECS